MKGGAPAMDASRAARRRCFSSIQRQTGSSAGKPRLRKAFLIPAAKVSISPTLGPEGVKRQALFSRRAVIVSYIVYPDPDKPETNNLISPSAPRTLGYKIDWRLAGGDGGTIAPVTGKYKRGSGTCFPLLT